MFCEFDRFLRITASVVVLGLCSVATCARAESSINQPVALDIKPGSIDTALTQLSRATGIQIVADPAVLAGKKTNGVHGTLDFTHALDALLSGQNLTYARKGDTVLIKALVKASASGETGGQEAMLESVVVTGFRPSLERALAEKRSAANVVEVIRSEDIGKFPSNNIAEALQRVPGLSITRDRGEGLFVRVRGLGPQFQNVTIDGRTAAVNENVRDSGQYGRQFRFDTLPSELVASVEVAKSPLASQDEGAIGGTVDIRTFKPLDFADPTLALSYTASYVQLAEKIDPKVSGLVSWVDDSHKFGALLAVSYNHRSLRSDRITGVSWSANAIDVTGDGVADTKYTADSTRPTLERENRNRYGVTGRVQWRLDDNTEITLSDFYTFLDDKYDELTYSSDFSYGSLVAGTAQLRDGALVGGTTTVSTQIGHEVDDLTHANNLLDLAVSHHIGGLELTADVYWGNALSDTNKPITRTRVMDSVGKVAFSLPTVGSGVPSLSFLTTNLNSDILGFRRIEWRTIESLDSEVAGQLDAKYALNWGPIAQLRAGFKYLDRFRRYSRRDINFTTDTNGTTVGKNGGGKKYDASFFRAFPVDNFLSEVSASLPKKWLVPDFDSFWAVLNTSAITSTSLTASDLRNSYYVGEKVTAGYVSADIDTSIAGMPLRGEAGLRIANTEQTSAGYAGTSAVAIPVSYTKNYLDLLPSLNLVLEASDDLQVHASVAKVITRPSLADVSPRLTLNSSGTIYTATGGNPLLDPFQAVQYDLSTEWYYDKGAALIGGVFYKDISTFVYPQSTHISVSGQDYLLTAPVNGGNAYVLGFELAWQQNFDFLPAPFDGLGALANYTHTMSRASYTASLRDDLQDVAKDSYNITVFYEKDDFGARLAYSWVGDVLESVGTGGLTNLNNKAYGSLDGNLTYKLTEYLTAVVDAQNLTNAAEWKFAANGQFGGYTFNGRTISIGLRARF